MDLVIRNGRVIDPASGLDGVRDVFIHAGRVADVRLPDRHPIDVPPDAEVIDASGLLVTPGLIDPHVHLREPGGEHKETIATGTRAAVIGGFTTVCCMPNTTPPIDGPELVEAVRRRAETTGACRVLVAGAATVGRVGEHPTEMRLMSRAGAVAFTDDGDGIASAGVMALVLREARDAGRPFMQHAQDPTLTRGSAMNSGATAIRLGLRGWPAVAEEVMVERDVRLNRAIGCRYHVQHVSAAGTVEIIRRARADGLPVSGEASPHHLTLTDEACAGAPDDPLGGWNTDAKVNPPLRSASDVRALVEGVADGTITLLATDHAPHAPDEKALPFEDAPFGLIGLESALPLYAGALVHAGAIAWARLIELLTVEPARLLGIGPDNADPALLALLGLPGPLGTLAPGSPADVTIIDPDRRWTLTPAELGSMSRNSPFLGRELRGRALGTIVGGRIRHDAGLALATGATR